jgi:hypothetical protein
VTRISAQRKLFPRTLFVGGPPSAIAAAALLSSPALQSGASALMSSTSNWVQIELSEMCEIFVGGWFK